MISWILNKLSRPVAIPPKGMFLGNSVRGGKPLVLDDSTLRSHVALSGRGGRGRTALLLQMLTQQTADGRGWVHIDPSGDERMRDHLAGAARDAGRLDEFYVLDLLDPANSHAYDVLSSGTAASRAQRVLTLLPYPDNAGAEHLHQQAAYFLTLLFDAVDATGRSAGLFEMSELLTRMGTAEFREQFMSSIPLGHPAGAALAGFLDGADAGRLKTLGGGLAGRLALLASLKGSDMFNHPEPEIDFGDVLAKGKMCLVRMSPMEKDEVACSRARMVVQDICTAISARAETPGSLRAPFLVAMDSFPGYGLSDAPNAPLGAATWAQARGMNVSLVPVVDSGSWDRVHAEYDTEIFSANTFTKVYFQQEASTKLAERHPLMAPGALESLRPGQFLMCQGGGVVAGQLRYTNHGTPPGYTKQVMAARKCAPRLQLLPPHKTP